MRNQHQNLHYCFFKFFSKIQFFLFRICSVYAEKKLLYKMSPNKYIYTFSSYETLQVHFSKIWDAKKEVMKIIKHLRKSPHLKRNEFVFSDATNNPRSKKRPPMLKVLLSVGVSYVKSSFCLLFLREINFLFTFF